MLTQNKKPTKVIKEFTVSEKFNKQTVLYSNCNVKNHIDSLYSNFNRRLKEDDFRH